VNELSPQQVAILQRMIDSGFSIVAFPLYANAVGLRKGECAALLDPVPGGGFRLYGEPCVLLDGNLTVRITKNGKTWFVWKKQRVQATPEKLQELDGYIEEVKLLLEPRA
jgi:hypothetical protein